MNHSDSESRRMRAIRMNQDDCEWLSMILNDSGWIWPNSKLFWKGKQKQTFVPVVYWPLNVATSPVWALGRPFWHTSVVKARVTPQLPKRNPICWLPASCTQREGEKRKTWRRSNLQSLAKGDLNSALHKRSKVSQASSPEESSTPPTHLHCCSTHITHSRLRHLQLYIFLTHYAHIKAGLELQRHKTSSPPFCRLRGRRACEQSV